MSNHAPLFVCLVLSGCISENRSEPTTSFTGTPTDTPADTVDDTSVVPDVSVTSTPDGGVTSVTEADSAPPVDTGVGPDVVIDPDARSCNEDEDCVPAQQGELNQCRVYECKGHQCVEKSAPNGTPCDDGTGRSATQCGADGWYGFTDTCKGGVCQAGEGSLPSTPLEGDWYTVISRTTGPVFATLRARLVVDDGGALAMKDIQSNENKWAEDMAKAGRACASPLGFTNLLYDAGDYVGYRNVGDDVFVFGGKNDAQIGIAVRPDGVETVLDGTYVLVATLSEGEVPAQLKTRVGTVDFVAGCISGSSGIGTGASSLSYLATGLTHCLVPATIGTTSGALQYLLAVTFLPSEGAPEQDGRKETWRGVTSRGGNLVLMTSDKTNNAPRFGTILLLKQPGGGAPFSTSLSDSWAMISQEDRAILTGTPGERPIVRRAELSIDGAASVTGTLYEPVARVTIMGEGWYLADAEGRYAQMLRAQPRTFYAGQGTVSADSQTSDFIAGFVGVDPPGTGNTATFLDPYPAAGSLMFLTTRQSWQ